MDEAGFFRKSPYKNNRQMLWQCFAYARYLPRYSADVVFKFFYQQIKLKK